MKQTSIGSIRFFVIATFLLFLVLFLITGAAVFGGAPELVQIVMKNVCAWSSTFVLVLFFKRFYPGRRFSDFFKAQFTSVKVSDFLVPTLIQLALAAGAIAGVMVFSGESLKSVELVSLSGLFPLLMINITSGPMGEELGWRAYALQELQKRLSPLAASLLIGLLWGLWHLPLWLVSGYTGLNLLLYIGFFLLGIISFSVFLTNFTTSPGTFWWRCGSIFSLTSSCRLSIWIYCRLLLPSRCCILQLQALSSFLTGKRWVTKDRTPLCEINRSRGVRKDKADFSSCPGLKRAVSPGKIRKQNGIGAEY